MAEKIVSPGVFTRENDLSFLPQGISQIGAAVVGPTEKGPAFLPTLIQTQQEYEAIFGTPKDYYTGYAVQNYLRDAGAVTIRFNEPHWPFPKHEIKRCKEIRHFTFDLDTVPPAPF